MQQIHRSQIHWVANQEHTSDQSHVCLPSPLALTEAELTCHRYHHSLGGGIVLTSFLERKKLTNPPTKTSGATILFCYVLPDRIDLQSRIS